MARKGKSFSREEPHVTREENKNPYQVKASEQGYPSVSSWDRSTLPEMPELMNHETARKEIDNTFTVSDPLGQQIRFTHEIITHWESEKGYTPENVNGRLERLKMARETVQKPHEIWDQGTQQVYVQVFKKETGGRKGCVVFVRNNRVVRSYYPLNFKELDSRRKGILIKKEETA